MLLAIDIGNSNIVIAIHTGDVWIVQWRIPTDIGRSTIEYRTQLLALMNQSGISPGSIQGSVISSVVPSLTITFKTITDEMTGTETVIVSNDLVTGLVRERIPEEIGSDLLANAVQAHHAYPDTDCMVIDFGTALTFTTVSRIGEILGVAIAPGLRTSINALFSETAQLPKIELEMPDHVLGLNTVDSIRAGIIYGYTGLVEKLIERTEIEVGRELHIIATGGLSGIIAPHIKEIDRIDSWHTLEGLRQIYEMNRLRCFRYHIMCMDP